MKTKLTQIVEHVFPKSKTFQSMLETDFIDGRILINTTKDTKYMELLFSNSDIYYNYASMLLLKSGHYDGKRKCWVIRFKNIF